MTTIDQLAPLQELWLKPQQYCLIRLEGRANYVIFERCARQAVVIEDDALASAVVDRMLEAGVEVRATLPDD